jgi:hypothetical protein
VPSGENILADMVDPGDERQATVVPRHSVHRLFSRDLAMRIARVGGRSIDASDGDPMVVRKRVTSGILLAPGIKIRGESIPSLRMTGSVGLTASHKDRPARCK